MNLLIIIHGNQCIPGSINLGKILWNNQLISPTIYWKLESWNSVNHSIVWIIGVWVYITNESNGFIKFWTTDFWEVCSL